MLQKHLMRLLLTVIPVCLSGCASLWTDRQSQDGADCPQCRKRNSLARLQLVALEAAECRSCKSTSTRAGSVPRYRFAILLGTLDWRLSTLRQCAILSARRCQG